MFGKKEKKEKKSGRLFRGVGTLILLAAVFFLGTWFGKGGGFGFGGNGEGNGDGKGTVGSIINQAKEAGQSIIDKATEIYEEALTSPTPRTEAPKLTNTPEPAPTDTPLPTPTPVVKTEITIAVEVRSIYLDGELCNDVNALKDGINKLQASGNTLPYVKEFGNGINSVVLEVETMLNEIAPALKMNFK